MGKTLIIAEKPSLAKNICAAIKPTLRWTGGKVKGTGYYENNDYIVSYAFGHLLTLQDAEDYSEEYKSWRTEVLPIVPEKFEYKSASDAGAKAQLALLRSLINDKRIGKIVNAGDSDREGEIIIRNILSACKNRKPVYRLWMPDQTPQTIASEIAAMKSDAQYDNLANEGWARTFVDWLYGINLTRYVSVKANSYNVCRKALRIGRVTSPIVVEICKREREIRNFVPENYYIAKDSKSGLDLSSQKKCKTQEECQKICDEYNNSKTYVKEKTCSRKTISRPKLFALSDLQGAAGRSLKWSPKKVLDVLQSLYEKGFCSYPRTNSRYMAENEKDKAKSIIAAVSSALSDSKISFRDSKEIFDSSKIEAHSAITPTTQFPNSLSDEEQELYDIILKRFCAVFCTEDYVVNRTNAVIDNGIEEFKLTGDQLVQKGYTVYEPARALSDLPPFEKGDVLTPHFEPETKTTQPPDHYTAETLNAYLKNPYSSKEKKSMSEDKESFDIISDVEIGTEATRAGIIDGAIHSGYITLSQNKFGITSLGEYYCDSLAELGIDMTKERTLNLGKMLKQIYKNTLSINDAVSAAIDDLKILCNNAASITLEKPTGLDGVPIGAKCPKCGSDIVEKSKLFCCSNKDCSCAIFKEDRFFGSFGKIVSKSMAESLFGKGYVFVKGMKSKKTGKLFDARINISFPEDSKYPSYSFDFSPQQKK